MCGGKNERKWCLNAVVVGWRNPVMSRLVCLDACRELWGSTPGDGCEEDMPE